MDHSIFSHEDSSADSQTLKVLNDLCEGVYYDCEDRLPSDTYEKPLPETPASKRRNGEAEAYEANFISFDGTFETPIREHGMPLDTITEKDSITTMPSRMPTRNEDREPTDLRRELNRNSSAPAIPIEVESEAHSYRNFRSLDDKMLEEYRRRAQLQIVSEISDLRSSTELADAQEPEAQPVERLKTPEGLPRWPGDLPSHRPTARGGRTRTSAYVRGIYRRLVGSPLDGHHSEDETPAAVPSASRIPVPSRLARGDRTGLAYWRPLPSGHGALGGDIRHVPDTELVPTSPNGTGLYSASTQENVSPAKRMIKKSLSKIFNASPGPPVQDAAVRRHDNVPTAALPLSSACAIERLVTSPSEPPAIVERQPEDPASCQTAPSPTTFTEGSPIRGPIPKRVSSLLNDSPAKEAGSEHSKSREYSPLATPPSLRPQVEPNSPTASVRIVSDPSPARSCTSSQASSWALPTTPFPYPPSPNIYSTPPRSREDAAMNRSTIDGAMIVPSDRSSVNDYDAATDRQIAEDIRSSASNSSTSLVTGRSAYYPTPNITRFAMTSDPFVNRPELRVTNPTDEDGDVESSIYTPSTPVKIPSPLRPRRRNLQLSLFPDTQSPEARLPPFAPGIPIVRALRSVSSLMRGKASPQPSVSRQQPQHVKAKRSALPRSAVYGSDVKRCSHGRIMTPKPGKKVGDWRWRLRYRAREVKGGCWRCRISRLVTWRPSNLFPKRGGLHIRTPSGNGDTAITSIQHPLERVQRQRSKERNRKERIRKVLVWMPTRCYCQVVGEDSESTFSGPHTRERRMAKPVRVAEGRCVVE